MANLTPTDLHWASGITESEVDAWKSRFLALVGEKIAAIYFDPEEPIVDSEWWVLWRCRLNVFGNPVGMTWNLSSGRRGIYGTWRRG